MSPTALKLPNERASAEAQEALRALSGLKSRKATRGLKVHSEGDAKEIAISVPREAFDLFLEILGQMANGNAVTIVPVHAELTTQQAADLLNVSRPYLISLLDERKIPFRLIGTHRRVQAADLLAYKTKDDEERKAALEALSEEAEKLGLGY